MHDALDAEDAAADDAAAAVSPGPGDGGGSDGDFFAGALDDSPGSQWLDGDEVPEPSDDSAADAPPAAVAAAAAT